MNVMMRPQSPLLAIISLGSADGWDQKTSLMLGDITGFSCWLGALFSLSITQQHDIRASAGNIKPITEAASTSRSAMLMLRE